MRTQFGAERSTCACNHCRRWCKFMPGYLIPDDLQRLIPEGTDPFKWAEENLRASPGALVARAGIQFRINTLVPATKSDGSCKFLTDGEQCSIHADAPFGCAFFGCGASNEDTLSSDGLTQVWRSHVWKTLYHKLVKHLADRGLITEGPEEARKKMRESA